MLLILAGTKGRDATAACPPFRTVELHLRVESAIQSVMEDRGFAVACADLLSCIDDYLKTLDSLKELVGHAQWRLVMALAHREDMSAVMEESKQHH